MKPFGINVNAIGVWGVSRLWREVAEAEQSGGPSSQRVREMLATGIRPDPKENVPLVLFLASADSDHITGQYIEANSLPACLVQRGD